MARKSGKSIFVTSVRFFRLGCDHELFQTSYTRSNRMKGTKILRCFPHCCPEHIDRCYCGCSLHLLVTFEEMTLVQQQQVVVYARFEPVDDDVSCLQPGDHLPWPLQMTDSSDDRSISSRGSITPWMFAERESDLKQSQMPSNSILFVLNNCRFPKWFYGYESGATKSQRQMQHQLKAYVFGVRSNGATKVGDILEIAGSPSFTLVSYRRAGNPHGTRRRRRSNSALDAVESQETRRPSATSSVTSSVLEEKMNESEGRDDSGADVSAPEDDEQDEDKVIAVGSAEDAIPMAKKQKTGAEDPEGIDVKCENDITVSEEKADAVPVPAVETRLLEKPIQRHEDHCVPPTIVPSRPHHPSLPGQPSYRQEPPLQWTSVVPTESIQDQQEDDLLLWMHLNDQDDVVEKLQHLAILFTFIWHVPLHDYRLLMPSISTKLCHLWLEPIVMRTTHQDPRHHDAIRDVLAAFSMEPMLQHLQSTIATDAVYHTAMYRHVLMAIVEILVWMIGSSSLCQLFQRLVEAIGDAHDTSGIELAAFVTTLYDSIELRLQQRRPPPPPSSSSSLLFDRRRRRRSEAPKPTAKDLTIALLVDDILTLTHQDPRFKVLRQPLCDLMDGTVVHAMLQRVKQAFETQLQASYNTLLQQEERWHQEHLVDKTTSLCGHWLVDITSLIIRPVASHERRMAPSILSSLLSVYDGACVGLQMDVNDEKLSIWSLNPSPWAFQPVDQHGGMELVLDHQLRTVYTWLNGLSIDTIACASDWIVGDYMGSILMAPSHENAASDGGSEVELYAIESTRAHTSAWRVTIELHMMANGSSCAIKLRWFHGTIDRHFRPATKETLRKSVAKRQQVYEQCTWQHIGIIEANYIRLSS